MNNKMLEIVDRLNLLKDVIRRGNHADVEYFLDEGADIEVMDSDGTPLHVAIIVNDQVCCKLLMDRKANIEACDTYGRTPLLLAYELNNEKMCKLLLSHEANVNVCTKDGRSVLHLTNYNIHIVKMLLAAGARTDVKDKEGRTPREVAQRNSTPEVVSLLTVNQ